MNGQQPQWKEARKNLDIMLEAVSYLSQRHGHVKDPAIQTSIATAIDGVCQNINVLTSLMAGFMPSIDPSLAEESKTTEGEEPK